MTNRIDLHIHTTASDGSDTPAELAAKVAAAGLTVFSVTDHDTIEGALAMEGLVPGGIRFIRGVEFSCTSPGGNCHILGYGYDPDHPAFRAALEEGRQLRQEKLERRLTHLWERFGVRLPEADVAWLKSLQSPGKPHIGRILLDRGHAPDLDTAIRTYLKGVPGRDRIEAETAIRAIHAAGGIAVWAHPLGGEGEKRLTEENFHRLLAILRSYGLRGMECWYSRYTMAQVRFLLQQAALHSLTVTGGSDYHGANKKNIHLGKLNCENGDVQLQIPENMV